MEIFKCPTCRSDFFNPEELRQHRIRDHRNAFAEYGLGGGNG